ncbi:Putative exopolysaccharide biosynthesis protein [Moritella viscosa]|nr:oligosaccharide flippase family protein [Moritella viscosa]SGY94540.1 Putative exopolysaccharide biosynthesis protein [Moritella viscosa]
MIRNTSIYLSSSIISSLLPFALMPILTRYLSQNEYGKVAILQSFIMGISALIGFSVHSAAHRKYFDVGVSNDVLRDFNGACFHILILTTLLVLSIVYIINEKISILLNIPPQWVVFSVIIAVSNFIVQFRLSQWQARGEAKKFGTMQIIQSIFLVFSSLWFVAFLLKGGEGRVESLLITSLLFSMFSLYFLFKDELINLFSWNFSYIKEALSFGVPLIPHIVGGFLLVTIDRFLINDRLGFESVAVYMVAVQLSSALGIVFASINKAYTTWLFDNLKDNSIKIKYKIIRLSYSYFLLLACLAVLAFLFGPFFTVLIAGEKYRMAGTIIGLLCLGQIFNGAYYVVSGYVFFSKKTFSLSIVTFITGAVHLLLLFILLPIWGIVGAASAFAISSFFTFLFTWWLAGRCYPMPWLSSELFLCKNG